MSHTIRKVNFGNSALAEVTIVDYVQGGEAFTLAELGLTGPLEFAVFLQPLTFILPAQGNIVPVLSPGTGVVTLQNRPGIEIGSATGLNYSFIAVVHGA